MNLPTKITVMRLCLIPIIIIAYCFENKINWMFIITGSVFIFASVTDFLDGYIARKFKMVTTMGKFLDPIADKILVVCGLIISSVSNRLGIPYYVEICTIIIIAREFIISLFRQIAASKNIILAADTLGKYKTTSTMIALGALLYIPYGSPYGYINGSGINEDAGMAFWWIGIIFLGVATILTIISGIRYLIINKQVLYSEPSKLDMIKDVDIEFSDDLCIETLELFSKEDKYNVLLVQKKMNIDYKRAIKICFWIEVMGFIKIKDNKKVINVTKEEIEELKAKKIQYDLNKRKN